MISGHILTKCLSTLQSDFIDQGFSAMIGRCSDCACCSLTLTHLTTCPAIAASASLTPTQCVRSRCGRPGLIGTERTAS